MAQVFEPFTNVVRGARLSFFLKYQPNEKCDDANERKKTHTEREKCRCAFFLSKYLKRKKILLNFISKKKLFSNNKYMWRNQPKFKIEMSKAKQVSLMLQVTHSFVIFHRLLEFLSLCARIAQKAIAKNQ